MPTPHAAYRVIRLQPPHAAQYRACMLQAYADHPDAFTSTPDERAALPLSWWQERVRAEPLATEVVWGAMQDAALLGVVGLSFETRHKIRHKAHLFGMYVQAAWRGQGVGHALLTHALQHARTREGVRLIQLSVTDSNPAAIALYTAHGFSTYGLEENAVALPEGYIHKRLMVCDLWQGAA